MSKFDPATIIAAQIAQKTWAVPASVTLAQFAQESGYGTHMPKGSNNPFGIKARPGDPSVVAKTREVIGGKSVMVDAAFRKFADFAEAFDYHAKLLATAPVYGSAMLAWMAGNLVGGVKLMAKHYATDPGYATAILSIIKSQDLAQYDRQDMPPVPHPSPAPTPTPVPAKPYGLGQLIADIVSAILSLFKRKP